MPILQDHRLHKRIESGSTFSIIFGVIVVAAVIACAIWGFFIPKHRKKHELSTSGLKWNRSSILTTRGPRRPRKAYPSHPAVRPLLSKPSAAQILPTYNPRTESPFPDGPAVSLTNFCLDNKTRAHSSPLPITSISSNGLFTPVKRSDAGESKNRYHTLPRAIGAKDFAVESNAFGDAKDFILPVPEPLALKPRDAGRPPAVVRHLQKYGTPLRSSPTNSDKLLHPNKLFHVVQRAEMRDSYCSSTSMRVDHRQSDEAAAAAKDVVDIVGKATQQRAGERDSATVSGNPLSEETLRTKAENCKRMQDQELTVIHRLRSYRCLTEDQSSGLNRAGTLTRPKKSVEELRRLYTEEQKAVNIPTVHLSNAGTVSTFLTNTEGCSDLETVSTPATSLNLPASDLALLPASLCLKRSFEPNPVQGCGTPRRCTVDSTVTVAGPNHEKPLSKGNVSQGPISKNGRGFYHAGRRLTKPPPLSIYPGLKTLTPPASHARRSITDLSQAIFGPLMKTNTMRSRARASSVYSRDTQGFSMSATPITPDFPTPATDSFTERYTTGNPFRSQESVRTRIDEWTQRIEGQTAVLVPRSRRISPLLKSPTEFAKSAGEENGMLEKGTGVEMTPRQSRHETSRQDEEITDKDAPGGALWI